MKYFKLLVAYGVTAAFVCAVYVACGPAHECTTNSDCAKKGKDYKCEVDKKTKVKKCVKKDKPDPCTEGCTTDADCASCGSKTVCDNGVCSEPATGCPASCTSDSDCPADKCGKKTKCDGGKCVEPSTPGCPDSCTADADCPADKCGKKTKCDNGKCVEPSTPGCPDSCTADADCPADKCGKKTKCDNGKCVEPSTPGCPASCTDDTDCPADKCGKKTKCDGGVCKEPGTPTCPPSCTADADCAPCGAGYKCDGGQCKGGTTGNGQPGDECDPQTKPCAAGNVCIGISQTTAYCFQDCTGNESLCKGNTSDGRTNCKDFARKKDGTTISVCLGESAKDGPCGYDSKSQATCKSGEKPPLYCSKTVNPGKCTEAKYVQKGEDCNAGNDTTEPIKICDPSASIACDETTKKCVDATISPLYGKCGTGTFRCDDQKHICVTLSSGAKHGYCLEKCDPTNPQCAGGAECLKLSSGTQGACAPVGTGDVDNECSSSQGGADKLDTSKLCKKGTSCLIFAKGATTGLCLPIVPACAAGACASGRICLSLTSGKGACLKDCSSDPNACPSGTSCTDLSGNKVCGPDMSGTVPFGGLCTGADKATRCAKGFLCLRLQQTDPKGFCSADCTSTGTCPKYTDSSGKEFASSCTNAGNNKFCLFPCGQPNQTCPNPSAMDCKAVGSGDKFCFPK